MIQVSFVSCYPNKRDGDYRWQPCDSAFIEIKVDGHDFRIDIGDFNDGKGQRRGLHIVGPTKMQVEQTAINAASLFLPKE